ncbi:hypothetical protein D1AOALGA4SA_4627 [Olavius algarvensis Delta 1 endosymbiont]|nr:hypothetical protein D1AOALGA4SA_4627 [Olavius algarvensis Delta 1 endosymbiont]
MRFICYLFFVIWNLINVNIARYIIIFPVYHFSGLSPGVDYDGPKH